MSAIDLQKSVNSYYRFYSSTSQTSSTQQQFHARIQSTTEFKTSNADYIQYKTKKLHKMYSDLNERWDIHSSTFRKTENFMADAKRVEGHLAMLLSAIMEIEPLHLTNEVIFTFLNFHDILFATFDYNSVHLTNMMNTFIAYGGQTVGERMNYVKRINSIDQVADLLRLKPQDQMIIALNNAQKFRRSDSDIFRLFLSITDNLAPDSMEMKVYFNSVVQAHSAMIRQKMK